jgi:hypothetical protein
VAREVPELGEDFTLAAESLKRPAMWRSPSRRAVTVGADHLDVPAFLRRQSE